MSGWLDTSIKSYYFHAKIGKISKYNFLLVHSSLIIEIFLFPIRVSFHKRQVFYGNVHLVFPTYLGCVVETPIDHHGEEFQ